MAVLTGKKRGSAYNWKDDALYLLAWISDHATGATEDTLRVEGEIDRAQINRMRNIAGWGEIDESGVDNDDRS